MRTTFIRRNWSVCGIFWPVRTGRSPPAATPPPAFSKKIPTTHTILVEVLAAPSEAARAVLEGIAVVRFGVRGVHRSGVSTPLERG